jgi:Na+/proline symporter
VAWLNYLAAWITIGLGSIPGQDVYQRVMSAKSERVAVSSAWVAGVLYITVGLMPLALAAYIRAYHPQLVLGEGVDAQTAIPLFLVETLPPWLSLLFLGALLSAILSTGSGGLLAPSAILSENLLPKLLPKAYVDTHHLRLARYSVLGMAVVSLAMAVGSQSIHDLAQEASAISLVSLFAILVSGLFFRRKPSSFAAMCAIVAGFGCWLSAKGLATEVNPILYGLGASWAALFVGNWLVPRREKPYPTASIP